MISLPDLARAAARPRKKAVDPVAVTMTPPGSSREG